MLPRSLLLLLSAVAVASYGVSNPEIPFVLFGRPTEIGLSTRLVHLLVANDVPISPLLWVDL